MTRRRGVFSSRAFTQHFSSFSFFLPVGSSSVWGGGNFVLHAGVRARGVRRMARLPMKLPITFKCLNCNEIRPCEPRSRGRQCYCPAPACRRASKAASQRRWLSRPENKSYFRGAENCERVRQWRKDHPGYWRKKSPRPEVPPGTLQEISPEISPTPSIPQPVENEKVPAQQAPPGPRSALQEICFSQPALLVGLVSLLTGAALQEDIARTVRSLLDRGEDILRTEPGRPPHSHHENQTHSVSREAEARASPVQLDRSAPGP